MLPLILVAALLFQAQYPYEITDYSVSISLSEGKVHETITITLTPHDSLPIFECSFLYPLENLKVYDNEKNISHEVRGDLLLCYLNLSSPTPYTFTIEFDTSGYVSLVKEEKWVFSPIFRFSVPVQNFSLEITIPADMAVVSPIYPTPTSFYSYRETLIVKWKKESLDVEEEFLILLGYKRVAPPSRQYSVILSVFASAFIAFIGGLYLGRREKPAPEYVVADEKQVLDILKKANGKITQSDLVKNTGFSKAKISKILSDLERRNVVRKEKYKRTNLIFLEE